MANKVENEERRLGEQCRVGILVREEFGDNIAARHVDIIESVWGGKQVVDYTDRDEEPPVL